MEMPVPGIQREDGLIMVPESITLENLHFFELDKTFHVINHFLYHEVQTVKAPEKLDEWEERKKKCIVIPFRKDLH